MSSGHGILCMLRYVKMTKNDPTYSDGFSWLLAKGYWGSGTCAIPKNGSRSSRGHLSSSSTSTKILGSKRGQETILGGKSKQCAQSVQKFAIVDHFYAENVTFCLILSHLKLFGGISKGQNMHNHCIHIL